MKVYEWLLALAPEDQKACITAYLGIGLASLISHPGVPRNLAKAVEMLQKAVELDCEESDLHVNLGMALYQSQQFQRAEDELRMAERLRQQQGKPTDDVQEYLQWLKLREPFRRGTYHTAQMHVWQWPDGPIE